MNKIDDYVSEVLLHIRADRQVKHRIREDLIASLNERIAYESNREVDDVIFSLGTPAEMAEEYMANLDTSTALPKFAKAVYEKSPYFEYRSKASLCGVPWVHVKTRRWYGNRPGVARGIIAIGDVSIGCISLGGLALGGICLGGVSAGLCSFGGVAIAALLAAGGVAVGAAAIGGVSIGLIAMGGVALGQVAIGGVAVGKLTHELNSPVPPHGHLHGN
ncbi:hypothetical protein [Paenibacillus bouchesdurhonensis]|uniref:hypothetical protein n=1 Tax=Paenibacillus bouchesdurhonensis TaxID=1870990 RepID=UPI000DA6007D|nr:hypothetical protein [Paenibacillus bouchesdurhonensis]